MGLWFKIWFVFGVFRLGNFPNSRFLAFLRPSTVEKIRQYKQDIQTWLQSFSFQFSHHRFIYLATQQSNIWSNLSTSNDSQLKTNTIYNRILLNWMIIEQSNPIHIISKCERPVKTAHTYLQRYTFLECIWSFFSQLSVEAAHSMISLSLIKFFFFLCGLSKRCVCVDD